MKYIPTAIAGVFIIEPQVFADARGYFMECYKQSEFAAHCGNVNFLQDNESCSSYGVLRGLHLQSGIHAQAKLVRCIYGKVLDVAVDLRPSSKSFGQHVRVELSADNKRQLYLPRGMAHGFAVLSQQAIFTYKVDNHYAAHAEQCLRYDDPDIGIDWLLPPQDIVLSPKDQCGITLRDYAAAHCV
jgi:dTDP-4-dehydrorhamnose 3,5-epimerase